MLSRITNTMISIISIIIILLLILLLLLIIIIIIIIKKMLIIVIYEDRKGTNVVNTDGATAILMFLFGQGPFGNSR